jgi:hypothetical protein
MKTKEKEEKEKKIRRIRTNVTLTPQLFQKVKDSDLNLSAFLQIKLTEYFAYIEGNVPHSQTIQTYTPETHHQSTPPGKTTGKNSELLGELPVWGSLDILEACGASDLGSNPSAGVIVASFSR